MRTIFLLDPKNFEKEIRTKKITRFANFLKEFNDKTYYYRWLILTISQDFECNDFNIISNILCGEVKKIDIEDKIEISHARVICLDSEKNTLLSRLESEGYLFKDKKLKGIKYKICAIK